MNDRTQWNDTLGPFIDAFGRSAPSLEKVEVGDTDLRGKPMQSVSNAIQRGMWPKLRELKLRSCRLQSDDLMRLAEALSSSAHTRDIRKISITDHWQEHVSHDWIESLASAFRQGGCPKLESLDLYSHFVDNGL